MNLCYDALDLSIIRGKADEPAVEGAHTMTRAQLLGEVGALAGMLRGVGVAEGVTVMVAVDDPYVELLTLLATSRLGGTLVEWREGRVGEHRPHAVIADRALDYADHAPGTVVLLEGEPTDPLRDLPWETAMTAGRSDPAGSVRGDAKAIAWVLDTAVATEAAVKDDSRYGRWLAELIAGRPVLL